MSCRTPSLVCFIPFPFRVLLFLLKILLRTFKSADLYLCPVMSLIFPSFCAKFCSPSDKVEMLFRVTYSTALSYSMELLRHGTKKSVTKSSLSVLYCCFIAISFSPNNVWEILSYLKEIFFSKKISL